MRKNTLRIFRTYTSGILSVILVVCDVLPVLAMNSFTYDNQENKQVSALIESTEDLMTNSLSLDLTNNEYVSEDENVASMYKDETGFVDEKAVDNSTILSDKGPISNEADVINDFVVSDKESINTMFDGAGASIFAGGDGSIENPYLINTPEQLDSIRKNLNASYKLINDIDINSLGDWNSIGDFENKFRGNLNGDNHKIINLNAPFFYNLENAKIENCIFEKVNIVIGDCDLATIARNANNSIIYSCYAEGIVSGVGDAGNNEAGIVANNDGGRIVGVTFKGTVDGTYEVGGICSTNTGTIENCSCEPLDSESYIFGYNPGGIVANNSGNIIHASNSNFVCGNCWYSFEKGVGGIAAYNSGVIDKCMNRGKVRCIGYFCIGGICGDNYEEGLISNSYNEGEISSDASAPVFGISSNKGRIKNCYNSGLLKWCTDYDHSDEDAQEYGISLSSDSIDNCYYLNNVEQRGAGKCLSDTEMRNIESFVGFDFENIWTFSQSITGYPVLKEDVNGEGMSISIDDVVAQPDKIIFCVADTETKKSIPFSKIYIDDTPYNCDNMGILSIDWGENETHTVYAVAESYNNGIGRFVKLRKGEITNLFLTKKPDLTDIEYDIRGKRVNAKWGWDLFKNGETYNQNIAYAGLYLSDKSYSDKDDSTDDQSEINTALERLGFVGRCHFNYSDESNINNPAFSIASKEINIRDSKKVLIAVVVRGTHTGLHGDIQTDIQAAFDGFSIPTDNTYKKLKLYIDTNYGNYKKEDVMFFVTGHSLGGAISGKLIQRLLKDGYLAKNSYIYTYASPLYTIDFYDDGGYSNVYNVINVWDIVPTIPWKKHHVGNDLYFDQSGNDLSGKLKVEENHSLDKYREGVSNNQFEANVILYMRSRIACPVDVAVYKNGQLIARSIGEKVVYSDNDNPSIVLVTEGDEKYIYSFCDTQYEIEFLGTDKGTMKYELQTYNPSKDEISTKKTYESIELEKGKTLKGIVDVKSDNDHKTPEVSIYVTNADGEAIKEVETDGSEVEIGVNKIVAGQKINLKEVCFPDVTETITCYTVNNKKVASVSKSTLTGKKAGEITVTAQKKAGKNKYTDVAICKLIVLNKPKIKFSKSMTYDGQTIYAANYFTTTDTSLFGATYWESSKPGIVEVIDAKTGTLKAHKPGSAKITAYFGEKGKKGTLKVSAKLAVKKPAYQKSSYTIKTGGKMTLAMKNVTVALNPVWEVENTDIATATAQLKKNGSPTGKVTVTGLKAGETKLKAIIDGQEYICTINVTAPKISKSKLTVKVNKTATISLKNTKLPKSSNEWHSENESIATVAPGGKIKGISKGETVIWTETGGVRNECVVTVK